MFKSKSGFTIVELLIVIVVIGILAAISLVAYNQIQQNARDTERTSEVTALIKAIEMFKVENGNYPSVGSDNAGYNVTTLETHLVPKYISAIPQRPTSGSTTSDYSYVRGSIANDSFAVLVQYESKPDCHMGRNNQTTGWWGVGPC